MPSQDVALYGGPRPETSIVDAQAGPVSFVLQDGMINYVRVGAVEVVRRVYFAVRLADWDTVYPTITDLEHGQEGKTFWANWHSRATRGGADLEWGSEVRGQADGTIAYTVRANVLSAFSSPRIGLNLLLPADVTAGKMFELSGEKPTPQGTTRYHEFTRLVPRTLVASEFTQIRYSPAPGVDACCEMEGAEFDMEDQRNWTDATYKAFAALPFPYPDVPAGTELTQTFRLRFPVKIRRQKPIRPAVTLKVGGKVRGVAFPAIGVDLPSGAEPPREMEQQLLAAMRPAFLRAGLAADGQEGAFERAVRLAQGVGCGLLVSVTGATRHTAPAVTSALRQAEVSGVEILFLEYVGPDASALGPLRKAARDAEIKVPVGGPGAGDFGGRPALRTAADAGAAFLSWGVTPCVHQEDDETYMENTRGVRPQMETMRYTAPYAEQIIGPITLRSKWLRNPPDPRQRGLLAATYAAGVLKHVAETGALAATLFEPIGAAGLIYRPANYPQPEYDEAYAGGAGVPQVFPVYRVVAEACGLRGGPVRQVDSTDYLRAEALAVETPEGLKVIAFNKTRYDQEVVLSGLPTAATEATVAVLDASTVHAARQAPGCRPADLARRHVRVENGKLGLMLGPCAVAIVRI